MPKPQSPSARKNANNSEKQDGVKVLRQQPSPQNSETNVDLVGDKVPKPQSLNASKKAGNDEKHDGDEVPQQLKKRLRKRGMEVEVPDRNSTYNLRARRKKINYAHKNV